MKKTRSLRPVRLASLLFIEVIVGTSLVLGQHPTSDVVESPARVYPALSRAQPATPAPLPSPSPTQRVAATTPKPSPLPVVVLASVKAAPTPSHSPSLSPSPFPTPAPAPLASPSPSPEPTAPTPSPSPSAIPTPVLLLTPAPTPVLTPAIPEPIATPNPKPLPPAITPIAALPPITLIAKPVPRAVAWALAELNSPDPTWSNQLQAPWSGYCEAFVEIAYGTRHHYASAIANYTAQKAAGRIHLDSDPPIGALVFYSGSPHGHVAISLGDGRVVTTWGYAGQRYSVRQVGLHAFSTPYLGWAPAPSNWPLATK